MVASRLWILLAVLAVACQGSSPAAPSAAALAVSISPNPLAVPAASAPVTWNVTYRETAGIGLRMDHDEMVITDAAGVIAAQVNGYWVGSSGCHVCSGAAFRIEAGRTTTLSGLTATFLGPPRPGSFRYTIYYVDDRGNSLSSTVTVPVM